MNNSQPLHNEATIFLEKFISQADLLLSGNPDECSTIQFDDMSFEYTQDEVLQALDWLYCCNSITPEHVPAVITRIQTTFTNHCDFYSLYDRVADLVSEHLSGQKNLRCRYTAKHTKEFFKSMFMASLSKYGYDVLLSRHASPVT